MSATPGKPDDAKKPPSERRPKDSEFFELPPDLKAAAGAPAVPHGQRTPPKPLKAPPTLDQRAVFALVAAVAGGPLAVAMWAGLLFPAAALGLGLWARKEIAASDGRRSGARLALVAVILGALGLLGGIIARVV